MKNRKYKLVNKTKLLPGSNWSSKKTFYQLQALVDIPLHGVKAGDLGGFVRHKNILSHDGSCWVGGTARAYGHVEILDDAYVGGQVLILNDHKYPLITISEQAKILGEVVVNIYDESGAIGGLEIEESIKIFGNTTLSGDIGVFNRSNISGNANISGDVEIEDCTITGETIIEDNVTMGLKVKVFGTSRLSGNAVIGENVTLENCLVIGKAQIAEGTFFSDQSFTKEGIFKNHETPVFVIGNNEGKGESSMQEMPAPTIKTTATGDPKTENFKAEHSKSDKLQKYFEEVVSKIDAYQTDIVKIIKYPLMTEKTDSCTIAMTLALNKATRLSMDTMDALIPEDLIAFHDAIEDLETKFILAESNALKMASTLLSEAEIKKTTKASDLFRLASNEAASDNEKKVAFIQGFKHLEGILVVPEEAVMKFQAKIGLREIEA